MTAFDDLGRAFEEVATAIREALTPVFLRMIAALQAFVDRYAAREAVARYAVERLDIAESDIRSVVPAADGWVVRLWNGRRIPITDPMEGPAHAR